MNDTNIPSSMTDTNATAPATDTTAAGTLPLLPDRLSTDFRSPHHVAAVFEHEVGIRFNGKERSDVNEYCISEGWVKVPAGKTVDRKGQPLMIKLKGKVEAFYRPA
jgi:hypothetical protein